MKTEEILKAERRDKRRRNRRKMRVTGRSTVVLAQTIRSQNAAKKSNKRG